MTRGISDHALYEYEVKRDYIGAMFHDGDMDGAYEDIVTWEGIGLPQEHFPSQTVNFDGVRPSWTVRYLARSWTLGIVIPIEDQQDDLYNIIHRFFPMTGGEWGRSYQSLKQILGAQFFGLYGFQSGTSVPFAPDGLSFGNTAHPMSYANQTQTWSNTTSTAADLSISTAQIARANLKTQPRPNGVQKLEAVLARVMCHTNEELIARQIFNYGERERGTNENNRNYLADENVDIVSNPYFEYSGSAGAGASPAAFNTVVFQGDIHYCHWKRRMAMKTYPFFDNTIMADVITALSRFAYGLDDIRGLFFLRGL